MGLIRTDLTRLRDEEQPEHLAIKETMSETGKRQYKFKYDLYAVVHGCNLVYEARYPSGSDCVEGSGQICIAASLRPGSK